MQELKLSQSPKLQKHYDHVVVGLSLASLRWAQRLKAKGQTFCILAPITTSPSQCKWFAKANENIFVEPPMIHAFENFKEELEDLTWLSSLSSQFQTLPGPPLHYNQGQFKSFLGFGDRKIEGLDLFQALCTKNTHYLPGQPEALWKELSADLQDLIFFDQNIYDMSFDEDRLDHLVINGKTPLRAKEFTFFDQFHWTLKKMAEADSSMAVKMRKLKWFTSVNVTYLHTEENPKDRGEWGHPYLLMGSKNIPCQGVFTPLGDRGFLSRWQCFIPGELSEDSETTGMAVKEIKKQVKRAFPRLWQEAPAEHIALAPRQRANLDVFSEKVSKFNNLNLVSSQFLGRHGWLADMVTQERGLLAESLEPLSPEAQL